MLQLLTAATTEIDDPEAAVAEILEQVDIQNGLLENSVGIVACHPEFVRTGVLDALRARLPFEMIGCTVMGSATRGNYSLEQLSLAVLTSDELRFATALSPGISKDNVRDSVQEAWRRGRDKLPGAPGLVMAFGPIMPDVSGDYLLRQLDAACGGVPVFGTLANGASSNYQESFAFLNGEAHPRKLALLQICGPLHPRFYIASISPKSIQHQKAVVTESDGYMVKKVNNLPFAEYLSSIGVRQDTITALTTLPFMVDYGDGTEPVALAIYFVSPEGALCGGELPVGAGITFTQIDYRNVMETAEAALSQALEDVEQNGANGILAIPCLTRCLMISPNSEDEMRKTVDLIGDRLPFMLFYSGGEFCPVHGSAGAMVNRFHNYTYTLAVL